MSQLCLLFDCDGTLVDSEPLLAEVMADTLTRAGLPFSAREYMERFRGVRFMNIVAELERHHGTLPDTVRDAAEIEMRRALAERMRRELQPIPNVRDTLEALGAYPRCVASNGPEHKIRTALDSTGLRPFFDDRLFSGYTLNSWKPDPFLFLHAAQAMGFDPEHCLVIDDAAVGVAAGLKAGMRVVHINRFPDAETTPSGAICMTDMGELPGIVAQLSQLELIAR